MSKILHVNVANKIATYLTRDGEVVCGNADYQVKFSFDSEWDGATGLTARFIWAGNVQDVPLTNNACTLPMLNNATECRVGVYASEMRTTTAAVIPCRLSILCGEGSTPTPPTWAGFHLDFNDASYTLGIVDAWGRPAHNESKKVTLPFDGINQNIDGLLGTTAELSELVSGLGFDTQQLKSELDALDARMYDAEDSIIAVRDRVTANEKSIVELNSRMTNADGSIKYLKSSVSLIWTILENTVITVTTVEDTFTTRNTAGGLPVVDEAPTTVHTISGATSATVNLLDESKFMPITISDKDYVKNLPFTIAAGTYTFSTRLTDGTVVNNSLGVLLRNSAGETVLDINVGSTAGASYTFTVTEEQAQSITTLLIYINTVAAGKTVAYFMLNEGSTALPHESYFAGLKHATFGGVVSTGANLVDFSDAPQGKINVETGIVNTANDYWFTAEAYFPCVAGQEYRYTTEYRTTEYKTAVAAFYDGAKTFLSAQQIMGNAPKLSVVAPEGAQYMRWSFAKASDPAVRPQEPMVYIGRSSAIPTYVPYVGDTSFALTAPVALGKWDRIDADAGKRIVGTVTETSETPYTEEQLAQYDEYILSADGKTIAYPAATPTEEALTMPTKTYKAWCGGQETITGNPSGLPLTVTQDYYEEVSKA